MRILTAFLCLIAVACAHGGAVRYSDRDEVRAFARRLADEHGLNYAELLGLLRDAERQDAVLEAFERPAELVLDWGRYRARFVTRDRIEAGRVFWARHRQALAQAETRHGVPATVVLAILGIETGYGRYTGRHRVFDTLVTLAFDAPRRQDFFRKELGEFLFLCRDEGLDPRRPTGSYAGAMGLAQFIPSSYRHYAVDGDGDGRRDLFTSVADAAASVAHYLAQHRWLPGTAIVVPVRPPADFTPPEAPWTRGAPPNPPRIPVDDWRRAGLPLPQALEPALPAALLRLEADGEALHWLVLPNFYVITRYNRSTLYAMAVTELAAALQDAGPAVTP